MYSCKHFVMTVLIVISISLCCSNAKNDYTQLQRLQDSKEQLMQQDIDYDVRINACQTVIDTLEIFIAKNPNWEWAESARAALATWKDRKNELSESKDYEVVVSQLQKLQDSKEQLMQQGIDYDVRINACQTVIDSLEIFIAKHPTGHWSDGAQLAKAKWAERKSKLMENKAYDEITKIQEASELIMENSNDYDVRIHSCDNVLNALTSYKSHYLVGKSDNTIATSLESWQGRKAALEREIKSLREKAFNLNREEALRLSKQQHNFSNVEKIELEKRTENKEGNNINIKDIYNVRMVGAIIGTNIFKLRITVTSHIATDSKSVWVDDDSIVEE